jgi:hypothetical protein
MAIEIIKKSLFLTPRKTIYFMVYCVLVYFLSIIPVAMYFSQVADSGILSPDSDSIIIPIGSYFIEIIFLAPIVFAFIWFALKKYPGQVSYFVWDKKRIYWSSFWTIFFLSLLIIFIGFGIVQIRQGYFGGLYYFLTIPIFLILRASLVQSDWFIRNISNKTKG